MAYESSGGEVVDLGGCCKRRLRFEGESTCSNAVEQVDCRVVLKLKMGTMHELQSGAALG